MPDIKTFKEEQLEEINYELNCINDYKEELINKSEKIYSDRIAKINYSLSTNLGDSMRSHLEELKNKIINMGKIKYIEEELVKINGYITKANNKINSLNLLD